jgi:Flp pilus assembly pilin Flp
MNTIRKAVVAKIIDVENARNDEGSVAAEYGLLIAGIAVVIGAGAAVLGGAIDTLFRGISF